MTKPHVDQLSRPSRTAEAAGMALPPSSGLRPAFALMAAGVVLGFVGWNLFLFLYALNRAPHNDFGRFYMSARANLAGEEMYGWTPAVPENLESPLDGSIRQVPLWNMNPPHFHLLILPLAALPAGAAFGVWMFGGVAALGVSLRLILREIDGASFPQARQGLVLGVLAGVATHVMMVTGQVSWYLLVPVTLLWIDARRGRWNRAGAWLGIVAAWKPFLLIFLPWFVLHRRWRPLLCAAATAAVSFAVGLAVFGVDNHRGWLACLADADAWSWLHVNASLWGALTRSFTENPFYVPVVHVPAGMLKGVWLALCGVLGLATMAVIAWDRSADRVDRSVALLLVGAILFCPLGWNYYWFLPLGPIAALAVRWHRQEGDASPAEGTRLRWRRRLAALAAAGWFAPIYVTLTWTPGPLTTVTLGCAYFWTTLSIWLALVFDGWAHLQPPAWLAIGIKARLTIGKRQPARLKFARSGALQETAP